MLSFDNSPWILPINKPQGITSYDCIRQLKGPLLNYLGKGKGRRKLKIGHFGTLDPFAEGVLLLGTGKALKLMKFLQEDLSKSYWAEGNFSYSTDTGDITGSKIAESKFLNGVELSQIIEASTKFLGSYLQKPPYFSAVKHEGRPLYEWAREGIFVEKEAVERHIFQLRILNLREDRASFDCEVSSGTYIRGLWVDLMKDIGLEGHLSQLKRTKWGDLAVEECVGIDQARENVGDFLIRPDKIWQLPKIILHDWQEELFCRGQFLEAPHELGPRQWVYGAQENLLGLGVPYPVEGQTRLKVEVNLVE